MSPRGAESGALGRPGIPTAPPAPPYPLGSGANGKAPASHWLRALLLCRGPAPAQRLPRPPPPFPEPPPRPCPAGLSGPSGAPGPAGRPVGHRPPPPLAGAGLTCPSPPLPRRPERGSPSRWLHPRVPREPHSPSPPASTPGAARSRLGWWAGVKLAVSWASRRESGPTWDWPVNSFRAGDKRARDGPARRPDASQDALS